MSVLKATDPYASPLTDTELEAAMTEKCQPYRQVCRKLVDDKIKDQNLCNVTLLVFDKPQTTTSGKPVLGYFKVRGCWPDETSARYEAAKIIRNVDSKHKIMMAPVGHWLPITEDERTARETIQVDTEKTIDENEAEFKIKEKTEEEVARYKREIKEREEALKKGDIYDDPESINFFTMKVNTFIRLFTERRRLENQIKGIESSMQDTSVIVNDLARKFPNYCDEWLDVLNAERAKGGLPATAPEDDIMDALFSTKLTIEEGSSSDSGSSSSQ